MTHRRTAHAPRGSRLESVPTRTRLARVCLVYAVNEDTVFLGFVFQQTSESVELPAMEFLVPRLTPITRVAVLILADVAEVANSYLLYAFLDTPLNDVFRESVNEVVFASGEFPAGFSRTFRRPVLAFGLIFLAGELVLVFFQRVPRIQL